ncbi:MAG TPA: TetR/AcrR family transcriptional regulator [Actinomycetota bacterium]
MPAQEAEAARTRGEQGEKTRARLLDAAQTVFRERGYAATRIDDITAKAGTSHGAFYLYFQNKQDILEALAVETAEDMYALADALATIERGEESYESMRAWVERFIDAYDAHAPVVNAWIAADIEQDSRFARLGSEVLAEFAGRIGATIERIGPSDGLHAGAASIALVAMLERVSYFWLVRGTPLERDTVVDTLTRIWHAALFSRG